MNFVQFGLGILFGLILYKGEVASLLKIRAMFHFEEPDLYLIIGSAVLVGVISLQLLKRIERMHPPRTPFSYPKKEMNKGVLIGGFCFGMGWYLTGACPGPIAVQIGAGAWPAVATFVGALLGTYIFARYKDKLPQ